MDVAMNQSLVRASLHRNLQRRAFARRELVLLRCSRSATTVGVDLGDLKRTRAGIGEDYIGREALLLRVTPKIQRGRDGLELSPGITHYNQNHEVKQCRLQKVGHRRTLPVLPPDRKP